MFFPARLLPICRPDSLVVTKFSVVLSQVIFKLIHALLFIPYFMKFLLSNIHVSILAVNCLFSVAAWQTHYEYDFESGSFQGGM